MNRRRRYKAHRRRKLLKTWRDWFNTDIYQARVKYWRELLEDMRPTKGDE